MTIQEKIYIRLLTSLARLKGEEKVSDKAFRETVKKYLETDVTTTINFAIKLLSEELLVKTAILTALMEASNNWSEFQELFEKQKKALDTVEFPVGEIVDFEAVMRKILNTNK